MEIEITYQKETLGGAQVDADGLFWNICCKIFKPAGEIFRLYGISGFISEYLGIPGADGALECRVPKSHLPGGIFHVVAAREERGSWLPWTGQVDGVEVKSALLQARESEIYLALPPEEAVKFPEWVEGMEKIEFNKRDFALLKLTKDGKLPLIEIESGGTTNEEMDIIDPDAELYSEPSAGDSLGSAGAGGEDTGDKAGGADL